MVSSCGNHTVLLIRFAIISHGGALFAKPLHLVGEVHMTKTFSAASSENASLLRSVEFSLKELLHLCLECLCIIVKAASGTHPGLVVFARFQVSPEGSRRG